jgi:hypothetical protein
VPDESTQGETNMGGQLRQLRGQRGSETLPSVGGSYEQFLDVEITVALEGESPT